MVDSGPQSGFAGFSDPRFQHALQQALPLLEMLVKIAHTYSPSNPAENPSPCTTCPKANQCSTPCDCLEALLPGKFAGSATLTNTVGDLIKDINSSDISDTDNNDEIPHKFDDSSLKAIDRVRSDEIFGLYKNCFHLFTQKEWRVITLRVQEGQTYRAIGEHLNIVTSAASDTFRRAKKKMEDHYRKQRSGGQNAKDNT